MATDPTKTFETHPKPDFIARAGDLLNLNVPDACRDGVAANLDLLQSHAAIVASALKAAKP